MAGKKKNWIELLGKPKRTGDVKQFELSPMWIGCITIVILVGIMFISTQNFGDTIAKSEKIMYEEQLIKVKRLAVLPGEKYTYTYRMGNVSIVDLTFWVMNGPGCTVLSLGGRTTDSFVCIDEWGVERGEGNISFSNPYIVLFKPWMLAVQDKWNWNTTVGIRIGKLQSQVFQMNFSTISKGNYRGREAWLVGMRTSDNNATVYFWIDEKKRVLLLENGTDYEIELIDGIVLANSTN
jgi:hypothetical protein